MSTRREKGEQLFISVNNYVVLDLETTGFSPYHDKIIQFSALKVSGGTIIDQYDEYINPETEISDFITNLTGIDNSTVQNARTFEEAARDIRSFIGDSIIVGHNINFDINFLYDNFYKVFGTPFDNDYIDTCRLSRAIIDDVYNYKLSTIAERLNVKFEGDAHNALNDVKVTQQIYELLKPQCSDLECRYSHGTYSPISKNSMRNNRGYYYDQQKSLISECNEIQNKVFVITGTLERLSRKEANDLIQLHKGIIGNSVTKNTDYLVLGSLEYCASIKGNKSIKQKRAEDLILQGFDISIISENDFYDLIEADNEEVVS